MVLGFPTPSLAEAINVSVGTLSLLPVETAIAPPVVERRLPASASVEHALEIAGEDNRLVASHVEGNRIAVSIRGDGNGVGAFEALLPGGLMPGVIAQQGRNNEVAFAITGNANLFAFSQVGSGNLVNGTVIGTRNQVAVTQLGDGNALNFSQHGQGNALGVRQVSW